MAKLNSQFESLATIFRVLGDQTRLRAMIALRGGELNVSALCDTLKVPQPTISRHLGILRMAGLVNNRRAGKEIFYSVGGAMGDIKLVRTLLQNAAKM